MARYIAVTSRILVAFIVGLAPFLAAGQIVTGGGGPRAASLLVADGLLANCVCGSTTVADTMKTYTLPAGQLANVGDMIHIVAGGKMAASTDAKNVRPKFGGVVLSNPIGSTAAQILWSVDIWVLKTGANTQTWWAQGGVINIYNGNSGGTLTQTDTAPIPITIDALNSTAATAASISTQMLVVQYFPAS